jgi:GNAT superfamily N-acetyltransferase
VRAIVPSDRRSDIAPTSLPRGYRPDWERDVVLTDGSVAHVRPIRPDDYECLIAFHEALSPDTIRLRFFSPHPHLRPDEVAHFTTVDYHDRVALVALIGSTMVAVGRYERLSGTTSAEVAFVVSDAYQGRGLGTLLLEGLADAGRSCGLDRFVADVLAENHRMLEVFRDAGFLEHHHYDQGVICVDLSIESSDAYREAHARRSLSRRALPSPPDP